MHFSEHPSLADGIFLRTWRAGLQKNQPKLPPAFPAMMDRGLVEIPDQPAELDRVAGTGKALGCHA